MPARPAIAPAVGNTTIFIVRTRMPTIRATVS